MASGSPMCPSPHNPVSIRVSPPNIENLPMPVSVDSDRHCLPIHLYFFDALLYSNSTLFKSEPPHDKTNKMVCGPVKKSNQPEHPPSLIRVLAVRSMGSFFMWTMKTLIRLRRCPGWSEFSMAAQSICLVLSCAGSFLDNNYRNFWVSNF